MSEEARFITVNGSQAKLLSPDGGEIYKPTPEGDVLMLFKMGGDEVDGGFDYFEIRVGYLGGPPVHIHPVQHETFHVLEGQLTVKLGDNLVEANAGEFLHIPKGVVHTYINLKEGTIARAVCNMSPGGFNTFMAELTAYQQTARPPDPKVMAEISARHKQAFVGPPLAASMGLRKAK
jgi:quercetin dioxygenase-like cupin family protein